MYRCVDETAGKWIQGSYTSQGSHLLTATS